MKIKLKQILITTSVLFFLAGCANVTRNSNDDMIPSDSVSESSTKTVAKNSESKAPDVEKDYSSYFNGTDGCAVFYDSNENTYYIYNKQLVDQESSPCSSFKIISCLMGLESGVISPSDSVRKWNGTYYPVKEWNNDLDYKDAFRYSCIWYYRSVINQLGKDYVQKILNELQYGNCDISEWEGSLNNLVFPDQKSLKELNGFWQESSLQVSPRELVTALKRIFRDKDIFSQENIDLVKEVMLVDNDNLDIKIYGKTGSGKKDDTWSDAWFVGMFETADDTIYFAIRLNQPGMNGSNAKQIALNIIPNEIWK